MNVRKLVNILILTLFILNVVPHLFIFHSGHDHVPGHKHISFGCNHNHDHSGHHPVHNPTFEHGACSVFHAVTLVQVQSYLFHETLFLGLSLEATEDLPVIAYNIDHPPQNS